MARVVIEVDRDELPPHSDEEFEAWVEFRLGHCAGIDSDNPLSDMDISATVVSIDD